MNILYPVPHQSQEGGCLRLAADVAQAHGGRIRAFFVVDTGGIESSGAGAPPGAIHLALLAAEEIIGRETKLGADRVAAVEKLCRAEGIPVEGEVTTGVPHDEIARAAADCDLLVSGLDAHYAYAENDKPASLALSLMKDRTVPALLAASPYRPVRTVVIGCGGGERTLRAVGAMAKLGLWKEGVRVVLLAVSDVPERAEAMLAGPRGILSAAGYPVVEERSAPGPKVDRFVERCKAEGADAVVLGGWGEHRWDDIFGFSITGRMLRNAEHHLFLYM